MASNGHHHQQPQMYVFSISRTFLTLPCSEGMGHTTYRSSSGRDQTLQDARSSICSCPSWSHPDGTSLSVLLHVDICLQRDSGPSQSVFLVPAALSTSSKAFLRQPLSRVLLSPVSDIRLRTPVHNWHHFFSGPAGLYMPWTRICQRNTFKLRGSFTLKSVFPSGLSLC